MPAIVYMDISHTSRITAEQQKFPRLPADALERSTVGELWRAWNSSPGMYANWYLENSEGGWWVESFVRPKVGQWMASLHSTV